MDAPPDNLPVPLTSFVGRQAETAAIRSLLADQRLVTVAGAGGCGKTRLAAHVAALAAADGDRWPDGVWWVELQAVTDPAAVPVHVANAVGALVEPVAGPSRSLIEHLRSARALMCLDNCEHVLDAAAQLVQALLTSCPGVAVLTTSREPLNLAGESTWRLPPLRDDEALELFVERARLVRPSFAVDDGNRPVLQRLCWGLDGIPLAIELAAAWARSLSPHQIEAGLGDRFSLLVRGARGAAARHQTLEASIAWSHDLLAERERVLLRRLAVFAGELGLDGAQAVCAGDGLAPAEVLPALDTLVDTSLVVVEEGPRESRFRLLESVRQYAWRQLDAAGELAAGRDRHLDHLVAVAEQAEPLLDHDKDGWLARLEPERENVRAALDWGLGPSAGDPERGRRLAAATAWLWNYQGHGPEGIAVLRRAMGRDPGARTRLQARLMLGFALVGDTAAPGDLDPVREGEAIARSLGDDRLRGRFLTLAAVGAFHNERGLDPAWRLCEEALALADATGDAHGRDLALPLQGLILLLRDEHEAAEALLAPVTERLVERGDRGIASTVLVFRSEAALDTGDVAAARRLAERAAEVAEPLADFHRVGTTRRQLAQLQGVGGDLDGALDRLHGFLGGRYLDPGSHAVDEAGTQVVVPGMARTLGQLHLWRGDLDEAERWLAPIAGPTHPEPGPGPGPVPDPGHGLPHPPDPQAMAPRAEVLRRQGRTAGAAAVLDHAEALARERGMPGILAGALDQRAHLAAADDPAGAADLHHAALQLRVDHGLVLGQVASLEALAALMARTGRPVEAARALAAAGSARAALGMPRPPVEAADEAATRALLEDALGDDDLATAAAEGAGTALDDAVALVRRARGRRGRPTVGWASLTPTELEVARLVSQGLGNPEIAAKLFVSRSTVKTHLVHIYAKLTITSRAELAATAARQLA
jgi:predicted ATPase/DNA-binding CsgD family transcriptional regulator